MFSVNTIKLPVSDVSLMQFRHNESNTFENGVMIIEAKCVCVLTLFQFKYWFTYC